jgi:hypothetical protein
MLLYPSSNTVVSQFFDPSVLSITVEARDFNGLSLPITPPTKAVDGTWSATLTIPAAAPLCTVATDYYTLTWINGTSRTILQFQVVGYSEGQEEPPPAALGIINQNLYDQVILPSNTDTISVSLLDLAGNVVLTADPSDITLVGENPGGKQYHVKFALGNNALPAGVTLYIGEYIMLWEFGQGALQAQEYRQTFMITSMTAALVTGLRNSLKQVMSAWLPRHQMHDVELIDCLYRAADRINTEPPQAWNFTPDRLQKLVPMALREAGVYEVLSRLYLAEGMAAFDYQGGSISANIDRTQYLQSRMQEATSWLDSHLKQNKLMAARKSGLSPIGALRITVSPTGNNNNFAAIRPSTAEMFALSGARSYFFAS